MNNACTPIDCYSLNVAVKERLGQFQLRVVLFVFINNACTPIDCYSLNVAVNERLGVSTSGCSVCFYE